MSILLLSVRILIQMEPFDVVGMDLRRARRNLQLVGELENEDDNLEQRNVADTQVPEEMGFSSPPESVFVSTQVQSRLDDVEQEESVKGLLKRFKYEDEEPGESKKAHGIKRKKPTQKRKHKNIDEYGDSKGGKLLKQLSGKHKKVKDMINSQRKKTSVRGHSQYDTYNAEEWGYIHQKILKRFPQSGASEMKQVFHHIYGEVGCDLWSASQQPPEGDDSVLEPVPIGKAAGNHEVNVLTLSQVMSDKSIVEPEDDENDDSTIPDSTDDASIVIPISDHVETQFYTPRTTPPDEIIDLTQESFKVVKSLISPLKDADTPLVQVPATRTSTVRFQPPCADPAKCLTVKLPRRQVALLKEKLSSKFDIAEENGGVLDTEVEDLDQCTFYLQPKVRSPIKEVSKLATQSAQKLRQSIKIIGLKPSRSKSQMIASLEAASQVLDSSVTELEQLQLIYENLTTLVQACPSLLERIYTFQPISVEDLLAKLIKANPFVDQIDEVTIRTWADLQGICLTNS